MKKFLAAGGEYELTEEALCAQDLTVAKEGQHSCKSFETPAIIMKK